MALALSYKMTLIFGIFLYLYFIFDKSILPINSVISLDHISNAGLELQITLVVLLVN